MCAFHSFGQMCNDKYPLLPLRMFSLPSERSARPPCPAACPAACPALPPRNRGLFLFFEREILNQLVHSPSSRSAWDWSRSPPPSPTRGCQGLRYLACLVLLVSQWCGAGSQTEQPGSPISHLPLGALWRLGMCRKILEQSLTHGKSSLKNIMFWRFY